MRLLWCLGPLVLIAQVTGACREEKPARETAPAPGEDSAQRAAPKGTPAAEPSKTGAGAIPADAAAPAPPDADVGAAAPLSTVRTDADIVTTVPAGLGDLAGRQLRVASERSRPDDLSGDDADACDIDRGAVEIVLAEGGKVLRRQVFDVECETGCDYSAEPRLGDVCGADSVSFLYDGATSLDTTWLRIIRRDWRTRVAGTGDSDRRRLLLWGVACGTLREVLASDAVEVPVDPNGPFGAPWSVGPRFEVAADTGSDGWQRLRVRAGPSDSWRHYVWSKKGCQYQRAPEP